MGTVSARALATALATAAICSGCYSAAPTAYAPAPPPTYYEPPPTQAPGYAPPSYPVVTIVTRVPEPPRYDGSIWYYGTHPHPAGHARGPFCHLSGAHHHDYAPYWSHRYEFHDGYYFWIGDPTPYRIHNPVYAYYGHHPHPHYFGGYCRIAKRHHHNYRPHRDHSYVLRSNVFHFTGVFGHDYHEPRHRYDHHGWRTDRRDYGYREHEHHWRKHRERKHHDEHHAEPEKPHRERHVEPDRRHRERHETVETAPKPQRTSREVVHRGPAGHRARGHDVEHVVPAHSDPTHAEPERRPSHRVRVDPEERTGVARTPERRALARELRARTTSPEAETGPSVAPAEGSRPKPAAHDRRVKRSRRKKDGDETDEDEGEFEPRRTGAGSR